MVNGKGIVKMVCGFDYKLVMETVKSLENLACEMPSVTVESISVLVVLQRESVLSNIVILDMSREKRGI